MLKGALGGDSSVVFDCALCGEHYCIRDHIFECQFIASSYDEYLERDILESYDDFYVESRLKMRFSPERRNQSHQSQEFLKNKKNCRLLTRKRHLERDLYSC